MYGIYLATWVVVIYIYIYIYLSLTHKYVINEGVDKDGTRIKS